MFFIECRNSIKNLLNKINALPCNPRTPSHALSLRSTRGTPLPQITAVLIFYLLVFYYFIKMSYSAVYPVISDDMLTAPCSRSPNPLSEKITMNRFCSGLISEYCSVSDDAEDPDDLNKVEP